MPEPLVPPESQYCDANGLPYAGGSITTYIPGTDTLKNTWTDLAGTALNTNPIVLDAAGRALIYGDGEYRFVLQDAVGNLIYDQLTTSFVSDAMQPVVMADTIADALALLGVTAAIQVETDRAMAAEGAETARAVAAEGVLTTNLAAETARAEGAEAGLQSQIAALGAGGSLPTIQSGNGGTSSGGTATVTFPTPYAATPVVIATVWSSALEAVWLAVDPTAVGFTVFAATVSGGTAVGCPAGFGWVAIGAL